MVAEVDGPATGGRDVERSAVGQQDVVAASSRSDVIDSQVRAQVVDQRLATELARLPTGNCLALVQFCTPTEQLYEWHFLHWFHRLTTLIIHHPFTLSLQA